MEHISAALAAAEARIALLSPADRAGAVYEYVSAGDPSSGSDQTAPGIWVMATQTTRGIRIDDIGTTQRFARQREAVTIMLTDAQQSDLGHRAVRRACIGD